MKVEKEFKEEFDQEYANAKYATNRSWITTVTKLILLKQL